MCAEETAPDEKAPLARKLENGMVIKVSFGSFNYRPRVAISAKPDCYSSTWILSDIFLHPSYIQKFLFSWNMKYRDL